MTRFYFALLLLAALSSSCQSSRPAFYFGHRPATPSATLAAVVPDSASRPAAPVAPATAPEQPPTQTAAATAPTTRRTERAVPARPHSMRQSPQHLAGRTFAVAARHHLLPRQPRQHLVRHRSATPVWLLLSLGALAILVAFGVNTLDVGLVASLVVLACLLAVAILLLIRTIWPVPESAAQGARRRVSRLPFRIRPTDGGIDALGRFLVKVALISAAVFLLTLVLGLILGSSVAAVIGGSGLALLALLTILLLSS